jgi:hypothetical protein
MQFCSSTSDRETPQNSVLANCHWESQLCLFCGIRIVLGQQLNLNCRLGDFEYVQQRRLETVIHSEFSRFLDPSGVSFLKARG